MSEAARLLEMATIVAFSGNLLVALSLFPKFPRVVTIFVTLQYLLVNVASMLCENAVASVAIITAGAALAGACLWRLEPRYKTMVTACNDGVGRQKHES